MSLLSCCIFTRRPKTEIISIAKLLHYCILYILISHMYTRVPFGLCATWNPVGDASLWKWTRSFKVTQQKSQLTNLRWRKLWQKQQDMSSCWLFYRYYLLWTLYILDIIFIHQSCWVRSYYYIPWLLYSYSCESQVKDEPSRGHIFHPRPCVRRDNSSEVVERVWGGTPSMTK